MDVISAYREVGTYRGAAAICGTTHKTVKRIIEAHESAGAPAAPKAPRARNYDEVTDLVEAAATLLIDLVASYEVAQRGFMDVRRAADPR